jgi:pyrimidine operon attenuation protein/uracil phosphoribosyltransferase
MNLDAEALYARLLVQVGDLLARQPARLVGIHSGGAWLAERLSRDLALDPPGLLDISFYRDDFDRIGLHPQVRPSTIEFAVDDAHLLLIDDVLFTGRTVRAAMNELFDYGRPASIRLAVLIDRDGRELPVAADVAASRLELGADARAILSRSDDGQFNLVVRRRDDPPART